MSAQQITEEELARRWRESRSAEERASLREQLLSPYLDRVTRWALRHTRDRQEAQDVAQDALVAICSHLDSFLGESLFSTWVYTIVRNQSLKNRARRRETSIDDLAQQADGLPGPERSYARAQRAEEARNLIASQLTELEAKVFLLHFGNDVSLAAIERELDLRNRSGARAYLVSAKRKLRRKLERTARTAETRREKHRQAVREREP